MEKTISLNHDYYAIVDEKTYNELAKYNWYLDGDGYAARMAKRPNGQRIVLRMHWCIKRAPCGFVVDHINGNRLDNRSQNLRICTRAQNNINKRVNQKGNSSQFKGVCWREHAKAWKAYIKKNHKQIHLGYFKDEIEAAKAYNNAAVNLFGEYALLNELPKGADHFEEVWA